MFKEFKNNKCIVLYGDLDEEYFNISPVWCHHNNYEEVIDISSIGVSKKWLDDAFINFSEKIKFEYQIHPYFTVLEPYDYSKCEFVLLKSQFYIADTIFEGYLYLIHGKLNAINVFSKNSTEELVFNSNSFLDEDNFEELLILQSVYKFDKKYINNSHFTIKILLDNRIDNYNIPEFIEIPIKKPKEI